MYSKNEAILNFKNKTQTDEKRFMFFFQKIEPGDFFYQKVETDQPMERVLIQPISTTAVIEFYKRV